MKKPTYSSPCALIILDGFGYREEKEYNAIKNANTPFIDKLWKENPNTLLTCSGMDVGLPKGQMGNSEVGHITIGAGRVVYQDYTKVNLAIQDKTFFKNPAFIEGLKKAKTANSAVHVLGLLSPGGVHSHEDHIFAFIQMAHDFGIKEIYIHAFLDGRDTPPSSALSSINKLEKLLQKLQVGKIASIAGRYYAMDRDRRYERTAKAYEAITEGKAEYSAESAEIALKNAYARCETDEFVKPTIIINNRKNTQTSNEDNDNLNNQCIKDNDVVVFMNFRADRARQLSHALIDENFDGFKRNVKLKLGSFVTLTKYAITIKSEVAFSQAKIINGLGEVIQDHKLKQLRIAETEKYAHVTFFFNGGKGIQFEGEDRELIPSPKVATYDLQPEMSANKVTARLCELIKEKKYNFILCNFANADMVGHTGDFKATVLAIETLDKCLEKVIKTLKKVNGEAVITADHGNAEMMFDKNLNQPHTAHTNDAVPCVYVGDKKITKVAMHASLKDVAPTILALMGISKPIEMDGESIFKF